MAAGAGWRSPLDPESSPTGIVKISWRLLFWSLLLGALVRGPVAGCRVIAVGFGVVWCGGWTCALRPAACRRCVWCGFMALEVWGVLSADALPEFSHYNLWGRILLRLSSKCLCDGASFGLGIRAVLSLFQQPR